MLRMFHHYAHALETRFFQLHELRMLRRQGVRFDKRFYRDVLRSPGRTEDWVNLARFLKIDPELALKRANGRFVSRFHAMEGLARQTGRAFAELPRNEMEKLWDRAKEKEKRASRGALPEKSRAGRGATS